MEQFKVNAVSVLQNYGFDNLQYCGPHFRHLKLHLENKIDVSNEEWNDEKEMFHYFSMHDLNKDAVIDGLEIMKAITHDHSGQPSFFWLQNFRQFAHFFLKNDVPFCKLKIN